MSDCDVDGSDSFIYSQKDLDLVASTLEIKYQVEDNLSHGRALFTASITLTNRCPVALGCSSKPWSIYFSHLRMVEPNFLPQEDSVDLKRFGVRVSHLNGCIFQMCPLKSFCPLKEGDCLSISFHAQHYSASKSDVLPNWYIYVQGLEPRVIKSTEGEALNFVGPFDTPKRYKRFDYIMATGKRRYDLYQPYTPEVRFFRYTEDRSKGATLKKVIPTPLSYETKSQQLIRVKFSEWRIVAEEPTFSREGKYLSDKSGIALSDKVEESTTQKPARTVVLRQAKLEQAASQESGAYELVADASCQCIQISAPCSTGAFYGVQSLLSLLADSPEGEAGVASIPDCVIRDRPRYQYRGMHVDVARNFHLKEEILRLLDVMSSYKMNKFHFHLTDDEGWRLEIPDLPELTQIGAKRGHDPKEEYCLLPMLGSGPFPEGLGCGFYSVEDYRDILSYAADRHIEVIPELDMPGHSHAAVCAMRARYHRLLAEDKKEEAEEFLLSDPAENGRPQAYSVQMMSDNSINPGLESTYRFINKVLSELKAMHRDLQPLRVFHLGGDEVPYEAWSDSPACQALLKSGQIDDMGKLMEYFVTRVGRLAHQHDLELAAWQDGIISQEIGPYKRSKFANKNVWAYVWRNVWETGQAFDAHKLANAGYQVVLAPGTHLYFDHPYEPDPEERGLFWACRFIDTHKVFRFAPDNLMSNADVKLTGEKISKADLKMLQELKDYTELEKPQNIQGLQGQLWTELIRTSEQFHSMIFPRLIALAERAWHKAPWEDKSDSLKQSLQEEDWCVFASTLGNKELKRLEAAHVPYHIPPPGARVSSDGQLELRCCYPGQPMFYSVDGGQTWEKYTGPVDVVACDEILVRVSFHNGLSFSRTATVKVKTYQASDEENS